MAARLARWNSKVTKHDPTASVNAPSASVDAGLGAVDWRAAIAGQFCMAVCFG
jgi:hypothetical protein